MDLPTKWLFNPILLSDSLAAGYSVKCEYTAHREGVIREELVLCSDTNDSASVTVIVQARVMGKFPGRCLLGALRHSGCVCKTMGT